MAEVTKNTKKINPVLIGVLILVVILAAVFLFQSGVLGGSSCEAIRAKYEKAKEVEHYGDVSKYYSQLMQMGCE